MTKIGTVIVCVIEALLGVFIGATTVYAIAKGDIYTGGAAMMATTMAITTLLAAKYVDNITKEDED